MTISKSGKSWRFCDRKVFAINDGVDSDKGDDDFIPFRNIMNEYYAKDTSRKIKSVFKAKGMSGKHMTGQVTVEIYFNFVGRYIPPTLAKFPLSPRGKRNYEKKGTQGQAPPKLFTPQGYRQTA